MQPGSSIMPGKINPVIPEAVNQVAFQVIGNDLTVTMAAEAGQLQLNAMEPIIAFNIFESMRILTAALHMLNDRCIKGVTANPEVCQGYLSRSIGIITALNRRIGYENASRIVKQALEQNSNIPDLIVEEGLMTASELAEVLKPENLIE
jgi:aspartate ammonia-lyase